MPSGIKPEHFNVCHVGKPRKRMPVCSMLGGQGGNHSIYCKPILYNWVVNDTEVIVIAYKAIVQHAAVGSKGD